MGGKFYQGVFVFLTEVALKLVDDFEGAEKLPALAVQWHTEQRLGLEFEFLIDISIDVVLMEALVDSSRLARFDNLPDDALIVRNA